MKALVLGGAKGVFADIDKALALFTPDIVLACNDIGVHWPGGLDHWCSMHPEKLPQWVKQRVDAGRLPPGTLWTADHKRQAAKCAVETLKSCGGSSGLLAVRVARHLGANRIVLAGVPLTRDAAHFFNKAPWGEAKIYQRVWVHEQDQWRPFVRSMSGLTKELFGAPDAAWLNEEMAA